MAERTTTTQGDTLLADDASSPPGDDAREPVAPPGDAPLDATEPVSDDTAPRPAHEPPPPRPPHLALGAALAALLLVTVVVSLVLQEHNRNRAVPVEDWQAGATYVREHYQHGDVVRVEPRWADSPRVYLDGATFDLAPEPNRDILDEYDRIWVIAGFNRAEVVRAEMPDAYREVSLTTFGDVDVLLYEVPPAARPRFEFTDAIADAKVRRLWPDTNRPAQPCALWRDDAWHCGHVDQFLYVGRRMRDMNDEPRYCIYAPPIPDNGWVEIAWPAVELGEVLSGRVGFDNWAVRSDRGSPTDFEVLIDGERRFATRLAPRDPTFHAWSIDTSERAGQTSAVTFRTHATDFFDRFVCFTARIPAP